MNNIFILVFIIGFVVGILFLAVASCIYVSGEKSKEEEKYIQQENNDYDVQ